MRSAIFNRATTTTRSGQSKVSGMVGELNCSALKGKLNQKISRQCVKVSTRKLESSCGSATARIALLAMARNRVRPGPSMT